MLEKALESPLDCKEIQPVHPKGNQSWTFTGRTDVDAEAPILWPPDAKNWLIGKDPDAGKNWKQEEKGMTKDEIVGWHHRLNGHEFKQAPGVGKPGVLQSMGTQRVRHNWVTELITIDLVFPGVLLQNVFTLSIKIFSDYKGEKCKVYSLPPPFLCSRKSHLKVYYFRLLKIFMVSEHISF